MFTRAIVRKPARTLASGLSMSKDRLGVPVYEKAVKQHEKYIEALKECGLDVLVLEADDKFADSVFVEDVALLTNKCAILTNPGAESRRGEVIGMESVLKKFYSEDSIERISPPGKVEAGDILMVKTHFFIGLSERTNDEGARQVIEHLGKYGMTGSVVPVSQSLHLKSSVAYLENGNHNCLVAVQDFAKRDEFRPFGFNVLRIDDESENYAANCISVNGVVLIPSGFRLAKAAISKAGFTVKELDMSEFEKLDGGLSCLSLRF